MKRRTVVELYTASVALLAIALCIQWFEKDLHVDTTIPIAIIILLATKVVAKSYKNK